MSASVLRTSVRRAATVNTKRMYTTAPPPAGPQQGNGNAGLLLGALAAGGAGYYLYQKSAGNS